MQIEEYYKLLLLFGSTLSVFMAVFLWIFPFKSFSTRVLGGGLMVWAMASAIYAFHSPRFFTTYPHLYGLDLGLSILFFPVIYVFIHAQLNPAYPGKLHYLLHGIPFLGFMLLQTPFFFKSGADKISLIENGNLPSHYIFVKELFAYLVVVQGIVYCVFAMRMLYEFDYSNIKQVRQAQERSIGWLKSLLVAIIVLWALGTTGMLISVMHVKLPFDHFDVFYFGVLILIAYEAYYIIHNPDIFMSDKLNTLVLNPEPLIGEKVEISADSADMERLINYLEKDRPYLNPELSMQNLVDATGLSKYRISELFNAELNKTFYDVINEYRVKEVKDLLVNGVFEEYSLDYIARKAGFNSSATFYRIFKKHTGQTPRGFIQSRKKIA